jgi:hypothetical protein
MRTTSAITIRTSRFPFAGVRWRSSKIGSVVTQFVAQTGGNLLLRSSDFQDVG